VIHYVAVQGEPRAVEDAARRLNAALEDTRFMAGEVEQHLAPSRRWALAAISVPDRLSTERLVVDGDDLLVVNGPALHADGQAALAPALLGRYRTGGSAAITDHLGGTYNVLAVTRERGLRAFPDFSGLYPLYWHRGSDLSVVSNRSTTVARVARTDGFDLHALAWVVGHANLFGGRMPANDVLYTTPGHELRAAFGSARLSLERGPTWGWPDADSGDGLDNLSDDEWTAVTDSLVANITALHEAEPALRLRLTGGKDSRLCLALTLAAGLRDDVQTITTGPWDSPEVEVAEAVAKVAGVRHERIGPAKDDTEAEPEPEPQPEPPPTEPVVHDPAISERTWSGLRRDVYRYEAAICAWSGLQNPLFPPALDIKGFGGEFYRRGNAAQFRDGEAATLDELAERFTHYHQTHDPLRVLQPDVAAFQVEWLRSWVHENALDVRLDLLPDKFYVDHRLSHWSGPLTQFVPLRINVNPLLTQTAARANAKLSVTARSAERFHYEVMRRAAPELVGVPFLNDTWKPAILADAPGDLPTDPFPITVRPQRPRSWGNPGWSMLEHDQLAMEKLFHRAMNTTGMGEICDMPRLKRLTRRAETITKSAQIKELFSAIGVALALVGQAEPVSDG
jgi:hypothetical protein